MSDIFENMKRIKMLGKIFLALSNNKIILGDSDKPNEHLTMLFKPNGILDIHKTKEGSQKEYESVGRFDMIKTAQKILSDPSTFMNGVKALVDSAKEVTFEEPEFADYKIAKFKTKEELASIVKRKKKDIIIPVESAEEFFPFKDTIPWNDAKGKLKEDALVLNTDGIPVGYLFNKQEKTFFFSIDMMNNQLISNFISIMTTPEKADPEKQYDPQGKD